MARVHQELKKRKPRRCRGRTEQVYKNLRSKFGGRIKGLDEIAGIGFRRSLEFLIKDIAIQEYPAEKTFIIEAPLGQVIKKLFVDYLPLMERAAWLGNDETHYERKHPDFGLKDLKNLMWYIISDIDAKKQREKILAIKPK